MTQHPPPRHTTVPAPPLPPHSSLPSDLAESLEARGPGQPRSTDPNIADAALVRAALASFSQAQDTARHDLNVRLDGIVREIKAVGTILGARLDDIEATLGAKLDTMGSEAKTIAHAVNEHTTQIKEVLRFATQNYDMITSATRDIDRVRQHLGISDERENESSEASTSSVGTEGGG